MGKQDHFAASYGRLNTYAFNQDETVEVEPVFFESSRLEILEERLLLFYTGQQRNASEILETQDSATPDTIELLARMQEFVQPMADVLSGNGEMSSIGPMLNESWMLKRSIATGVSSALIDDNYERAIRAGATGGKILGAGGGGFLLLYVDPEHQQTVIDELAPLQLIRSRFDTDGSRITYYEPSRFS
jgi:D-glycero-alpha-D-manno-heptose-7-phosphate kinase